MIRLRTQDGTALPVPAETAFVEIVNDHDQTVGCVLYSPAPGAVYQIWPGSEDARRYEGLFNKTGLRFADRIIHRVAS
jgi:hypothetical protein